MTPATNLRTGTSFEDGGQIYLVLSYEHIKMGRGSANIKVKVKNLRSGAMTEKSFISGARVEEIDLEKKKAQYLYADNEGFHFMENVTFEQFILGKELLGTQTKFLKDGMEVSVLSYGEEPLAVDLPLKMEFKVVEAGAGVRGDSVSNVYKDAILENGLKAKVPLFIKDGDKVLVDTRTGEYVERVK
ncbi:MAG: elongation factor P [Patescibacteria group bacterium]|nr:elongation factor P [bacterium]MDZ7587182.1 elongation factor P [Patescibacteria group bacterium]